MNKYLSQIKIIPLLFSAVNSLLICPISQANSTDHFALSEYWTIGEKVTLRFSIDETPQSAAPLHLKNGLALNFSEIMSLGDLYGTLDHPISHGLDPTEQKGRFKEVYNALAKNLLAVHEVKELNNVIKKELEEVQTGIAQGQKAEAIYQRIGNEIGRQINCITGGGCNQYGWWLYPGRYLLLALEDYDHFSPNNLIVYKSGHQLALEQALKAKRSGERIDLERAYAMEALAAHYLSDHFTAGHLRAPREELHNKLTPAVLGALLSTYMHQEDNRYGLHVHNNMGMQWVVYGDSSYFNPFNQTNRQMILSTVQQSVDELFTAYFTGEIPEHFAALDMVPYPESFNSESNLDIAPLFYWDDASKQLYRRADLSNPYDKHWTNSWWGWSTLLLLKNQYGISSTVQLSLSNYISPYLPNTVKQQWEEERIIT